METVDKQPHRQNDDDYDDDNLSEPFWSREKSHTRTKWRPGKHGKGLDIYATKRGNQQSVTGDPVDPLATKHGNRHQMSVSPRGLADEMLWQIQRGF